MSGWVGQSVIVSYFGSTELASLFWHQAENFDTCIACGACDKYQVCGLQVRFPASSCKWVGEPDQRNPGSPLPPSLCMWQLSCSSLPLFPETLSLPRPDLCWHSNANILCMNHEYHSKLGWTYQNSLTWIQIYCIIHKIQVNTLKKPYPENQKRTGLNR